MTNLLTIKNNPVGTLELHVQVCVSKTNSLIISIAFHRSCRFSVAPPPVLSQYYVARCSTDDAPLFSSDSESEWLSLSIVVLFS